MPKVFQQAMQLMRGRDPQARENGFALARDHAAELVDELIAEFAREQQDRGLRCWLLELIGEARSERAFATLAEQLQGPDEALRSWARIGLESLGTTAARRELWRARMNGAIL